MKITHSKDYTQARAEAYPSLAEFADAFYWHMRNDSRKMDAYLAKCDRVKKTYPKPEKPNGAV